MSISLPYNIVPDTLIDATTVEANFTEIEAKATDKTGDTFTGTMQTRLLEPSTDATYDIGTNSLRYKDLYLSGAIIGPSTGNAFGTVAVSGQSNVVADAVSDTLTLVAGTGITLTTNAGSDSVTIARASAGQTIVPGTSSILASVGGTLYNYQSVTGVGNVTTGEDTLYSQSVAANVLAADGDALQFVAAGTFAANANDKRIRVYFGSTLIFDLGTGYGIGGSWRVHGTIVRTSASTQMCETHIGFTTLPGTVQVVQASATLSSAATFSVTAEATATDDAVLKLARITYMPNTPN